MIRKRIDKSTPLLYKALANNEVIDGNVQVLRPNPSGDGTTEQFYTIEFTNGRVASFKAVSPDSIDPASATHPPLEEISFVFQTISWTYEPSGVMHQDSWRAQT